MKLPADPKLPIFGGTDYARSLYQRLYALFRQIAAAVNGNVDDISANATAITQMQADAQWLGKAIGEPFGLRDDLAGVTAPPTDSPDFRFIKLTAGDAYNAGVLTSESVSGSAPLVVATAVISLSGSPLNGKTVNLLNTEGRFLRGGTASGTLQDSQNLSHTHAPNTPLQFVVNTYPTGTNLLNPSSGAGNMNLNGGQTTAASGGSEARPRNQSATLYMRIL